MDENKRLLYAIRWGTKDARRAAADALVEKLGVEEALKAIETAFRNDSMYSDLKWFEGFDSYWNWREGHRFWYSGLVKENAGKLSLGFLQTQEHWLFADCLGEIGTLEARQELRLMLKERRLLVNVFKSIKKLNDIESLPLLFDILQDTGARAYHEKAADCIHALSSHLRALPSGEANAIAAVLPFEQLSFLSKRFELEPDPEIRKSLALLLGGFPEEKVAPLLLKELETENHASVAQSIVKALARFNSLEVKGALLKQLLVKNNIRVVETRGGGSVSGSFSGSFSSFFGFSGSFEGRANLGLSLAMTSTSDIPKADLETCGEIINALVGFKDPVVAAFFRTLVTAVRIDLSNTLRQHLNDAIREIERADKRNPDTLESLGIEKKQLLSQTTSKATATALELNTPFLYFWNWHGLIVGLKKSKAQRFAREAVQRKGKPMLALPAKA